MNLDQTTYIMDFPVDLHKPRDLIMSQDAICFQLAMWRYPAWFSSKIPPFMYCLILEPVDELGKLYRRSGLAEIPENLLDSMEWSTKTVSII